jgi:diguanylate cyclase (GGDEF)-like protein
LEIIENKNLAIMKKTKTAHGATNQQWISEHMLDFLYGNAPPSVIGSLAVVLVLAYTLWSQVPSESLFFWTFAGILIAAIRLALWFGYRKRKESRTIWFWLNSYRLMSFASGLLNGLAMWLFFENIPVAYQLLIFFSIVGLTAAASGTHAVDLPTFQLFMYSSCLLAITKLLTFGETTYYALSVMFVFYVLVMARTGRQTNTTLNQNFKLTQTMHYRATHDALVDLLNREEFENQFEIRLPLTRHGVAMLFMDLDNFKPLNDTLGHQAGDRALKEVADILVKSLRADDVVARLGGDEFVAFLFLDDSKEIEKIAEDILQSVNAITFPGQHNYAGLSASIGIGFNHNNQVMFSQLMRAADVACYKSKEQGKNKVTMSLIKTKD